MPTFTLTYFLIFTLMVFFMLLYVYPGNQLDIIQVESFDEPNKLIPADKLLVVQGLGVPDSEFKPAQPDTTDISAPSVDGTEQGPKSKFLFAFNQCKPECCSQSVGYTCAGGCPCLTKEQMKFATSRGFNFQNSKCSFDNEKNI